MRARLEHALLLVGSGVVLALAFPRSDWEVAGWFALTPLFVIALGARPRVAFAWGWLYGLTFFLVGRVFSNLGVLNDWPALFSAAFPLAIFVVLTISMLWWLERR